MTQYLISFDDGAMDMLGGDLPAVTRAALEVVRQAEAAGVWVFSGGVRNDAITLVSPDGTVTADAPPQRPAPLGGFADVDVRSREEAVHWAAKIARACRCVQEVWELVPDPNA
jgi:hypothetical protein